MMFSQGTYKTITEESNALFKSKGSKFHAHAFPLEKESEVKTYLNRIKEQYPGATHYCYAWVLGPDGQNFRCNDDGEPPNTAGKPIHRQIQKFELCNILLVVVRYFGGTMLGVPGLIEAYGTAAAECLANAMITEHSIIEKYRISCEFGLENEIFRLVRQFQLPISVLEGQECFSAEIKIPLHKVDAFKGQAGNLYRISIEYLGVE